MNPSKFSKSASWRLGFLLMLAFHWLLSGAESGRAQGGSVTISGHVYCVCDGGPVSGASVQLGSYSATTDANGFYTLSAVVPGAYTAMVGATNYATLTTSLTAASGVAAVTNDFSLTNTTVVINPIFDASIANDAQAPLITNSIKSAVQIYRTLLANPVCLNILFKEVTDGLGASLGSPQFIPYTQFLADLQANTNQSPNDTNALAHMPAGPNTGIAGNTMVTLTPANLAAIGETALAAQAVANNNGLNSTISLNISQMNITRTNQNPNLYDMQSTVLHEVDEALGIGGNGSALYLDGPYVTGTPVPTNGVAPLDFFRYSAPGVPSFTYDTNVSAYLSIDGGKTVLVHFNQSGNGSDGGDWGDGLVPADGQGNTPGQVQDAFGSPGVFEDLGTNEIIALDVAGYNLTPTAMAYLGLGKSSTVTNPVAPTLTWANPASIVYGTGLGATQLNATANVAGSFGYSVANGAILPAGTNTISVVFTPTDTNSYTTASAQVTLVVTPATPTITWATPANLTSGLPLGAAQLNATASVPGSFAYTPALGAILPSGSNTLNVVFTPTDGNDYTTASAQVTLVVTAAAPATPTLTWATPTAITYGTPVDTTQLNATANVPGSFAYTVTNGAVLPAGTNTITVVFTPLDTTSYTIASANVALVVNQAIPVITWANPASVASGVLLGATQLNATANVPGIFVYTPAIGATLPVGTNILNALFTPADTADYTTVALQVKLVVTQAAAVTPQLTWTNPAPVVYGTGLGAAQLNATANVPGSFGYSFTNGAVLPAGTNTISALFTPTDTTTYSTATAQVTLVVTPATPVITWANPMDLAFGVPLSSAQLNATANVAGSFAYSPAPGTILTAGTNVLGVVFTPTDGNDYTTASAQVTLVVTQATTSTPSLAITQLKGLITISWPVTAGFILESTIKLGAAASWSAVPADSFSTNQGTISYSPTVAAPGAFFRLRQIPN